MGKLFSILITFLLIVLMVTLAACSNAGSDASMLNVCTEVVTSGGGATAGSSETDEDIYSGEEADANGDSGEGGSNSSENPVGTHANLRWISGIRRLRSTVLEIHPRFAHDELAQRPENIERRRSFNEGIDALLTALPLLTEFEVVTEVQRIIAILEDNHTLFAGFHFDLTSNLESVLIGDRYPILFKMFDDGWYLVHSVEEYAHALNLKLTKINGVPVEEAFITFARFWSSENIYDARSAFASYLNAPGLLMALCVADGDLAVYTFTDGRNDEFDIVLATTYPFSFGRDSPLSFDTVELTDMRDAGEQPLFLMEDYPDQWYEYIEPHNVLYLRINRFHGDSWQNFDQSVRDIFEQNDIIAVIIDLRDNPGGQYIPEVLYDTFTHPDMVRSNSGSRHLLFEHLAENAPVGGVYCFTNEGSRSASLIAAAHLRSMGAVIVGQPLGQNMEFFAGIDIGVTMDFFQKYLLTISGTLITTRYLGIEPSADNVFRPDVPIAYTIADWVNNRDPLLEYVLEMLD